MIITEHLGLHEQKLVYYLHLGTLCYQTLYWNVALNWIKPRIFLLDIRLVLFDLDIALEYSLVAELPNIVTEPREGLYGDTKEEDDRWADDKCEQGAL